MHVRAAFLVLWILLHLAPEARSQKVGQENRVRTGYLRTVATHFRVSFREVDVLAAWNLQVQEVPVVLWVATRSGVSPDLVVSLKRDGLRWTVVARRLGLSPDELGLHEEPDALDPTDRDVVRSVNVRVLSRELGVSSRDVLEAYREAGDFVSAYGRLGGPGAS